MSRIIDQSLGNQVKPIGLKSLDDICQFDGVPLRKGRLVIGQAPDSGPYVFVGCTENSAIWDQATRFDSKGLNLPENSKDFINLRVAREERLTSGHFGDDTSNGPHINSSRVMP